MTATQLARVLGESPAVVSGIVRRMFCAGELVKCATGPRDGYAYRIC